MTPAPTDQDLERAREWLALHLNLHGPFALAHVKSLAAEFAKVREECAAAAEDEGREFLRSNGKFVMTGPAGMVRAIAASIRGQRSR